MDIFKFQPNFTIIEDILEFVNQTLYQHRYKFIYITGALTLGWLYNKLSVNRKLYISTQSMKGKTVLITGGNAGIGFTTAEDLLRRNARVVIACRDLKKGQAAVEKLCDETKCNPNNIRLMHCDLASYDSVREFARTYNDEEERLDVLICNAGLVWSPNIVTKDGFNTVIQSNYLGHFLLTNLLMDKLKTCRPSRIVNVSSGAHKQVQSIDWSDALTQFKTRNFFKWYSFSKAFQILSTYKLKHDHLADGVNCFSVHPGWVWTSIQQPMRQVFGFSLFLVCYPLIYLLSIILAKNPEAGALTTIYCAVEPSLENASDIYFEDCHPSKPTRPCVNQENADRLWKLSCEAVDL